LVKKYSFSILNFGLKRKKTLSAGVLAGQDYSDEGEDVRKWKKIKLMEKQLPYSFPQ
jgi:hypothetical protein